MSERLMDWIHQRKAWQWLLIFIGLSLALGFAPSYVLRNSSALKGAIADTGLVLQLIGLGTIAHAIHTLQKHFGHTSWWDKLWNRLGLSGGGKSQTINVSTESLDLSEPSPSIETSRKGLKERVEALEREQKKLQEKTKEIEKTHDEDTERIEDSISEVSGKVAHVEQRMERAHLGDLKIEGAGLVCLMVGLPLTTHPEWVAYFLN